MVQLIRKQCGYAEVLSAVKSLISSEAAIVDKIQRGELSQKISPRSTNIDVFDSARLVCLPDIHGIWRKDARRDTYDRASPVIRQMLPAAPSVIVQGTVLPSYLQRLSRKYHVIVAERRLEVVASHLEALSGSDLSNFTFVRGNLMFLLQMLRPSTLDAVVIASPKPYSSPRQSYDRSIHRDFFCMCHQALRQREHEADGSGVVVWTDHNQYFDFMLEQLDEAKLLCSFAKKKPSVFVDLLPEISEVANAESLHYLTASKKDATPASLLNANKSYPFERRYFRSLFPTKKQTGEQTDRKTIGSIEQTDRQV